VGFFLFILVNAALLIRPTEVVPELRTVPLFNYLILACLAASWPSVLRQFTDRTSGIHPVTGCVLGLLVAVVLSGLAQLDPEQAAEWGADFGKAVIYYLLLVGLVDTPQRLRLFLFWLVLFAAVLAVLALLSYYDYLDLSLGDINERVTDKATGLDEVVRRLRGPGVLFGDPNDVCAVFVVALLLCLYAAGDPRLGVLRLLWAALIGLFGYAMALTYSRGGFIGLLTGLFVLCQARYGRRRSLVLLALVVPALFAVFAGRMTDLSATGGTGQQRIQVWGDGLMRLRGAPLFGIGMHKFGEGGGELVAHNSFIHCYTELGLLGGTFFLGAFYLAFALLRRVGAEPWYLRDPESRRLHPFLLAVLAAYAACLMSLSLSYHMTTYLILGLVAVHARLCAGPAAFPPLRFDAALARRLALVSVTFLVLAYAFVRVFVRWV
jgi:hypothetical protein